MKTWKMSLQPARCFEVVFPAAARLSACVPLSHSALWWPNSVTIYRSRSDSSLEKQQESVLSFHLGIPRFIELEFEFKFQAQRLNISTKQ